MGYVFDERPKIDYRKRNMDIEFLLLQLKRSEVIELHAALVQRAMVEDEIRREKGLEPVASRPLLERLDRLVGLSDAQADKLGRALDGELWEHAWYTFTDEWAWFRALKQVEQELGPKAKTLPTVELQRRVELRYTKDFEKFVREIDMKYSSPSSHTRTQRRAV